MTLLRYLDVVLIVLAAPILLLIGVSATGYVVGGGSWILLRAIGVGVERYATAVHGQPSREITVRLGYLLGRVFLLALTVVLVRREDGRSAGLTALLVIAVAFTVQLVISALTRPRKR
ncbi:MAG: hypothetical protein JOZ73_11665 [Solirubrobacterales bacterium]|nr:hypothetical protein [Solirubrobacterales bacterium]